MIADDLDAIVSATDDPAAAWAALEEATAGLAEGERVAAVLHALRRDNATRDLVEEEAEIRGELADEEKRRSEWGRRGRFYAAIAMRAQDALGVDLVEWRRAEDARRTRDEDPR